MKILITGAKGFAGKNLTANLHNIRDGRDQTRSVVIEEVMEYDVDTDPALLRTYCERADFVFHLAGVNRPKRQDEFMEGNFGFSSVLLETLKECGNRCPVMLSSSIQAALTGRFADSAYGRSKLAGEELFFRYAEESGAPVLVYRFPNLFGKWCRPDYNSAVATFCHHIANDLPVQVNDRETALELLYIDDLVEAMIGALEGRVCRCDYHAAEAGESDGASVRPEEPPIPVPSENGKYCYVPVTYRATLGEIVDLLYSFKALSQTLILPEIPEGSFAKKLYATYLSYLPEREVGFSLKMNVDNRGIFTELLKTKNSGQISINVSRPGITRGQHWHNSKSEIFIVVSGHGLIQERRLGSDEVIEFEVSGEKLRAIQMLPGYTHNIINLSETENLVTIMWASEPFDPERPDTFYERVEG